MWIHGGSWSHITISPLLLRGAVRRTSCILIKGMDLVTFAAGTVLNLSTSYTEKVCASVYPRRAPFML